MRWVIVVVALVVVGAPAEAFELGNQRPEKPPHAAPVNVPAAVRQGGDTVLDATPIAGIPYTDTGTTTGYTDDYDEVCPYDGSTSPDVVYSLTLPQAAIVDIDLLGSAYDTKVYVYDENFALVACNDDFYADYVSKIEELALTAGVQYFIVIDGWNGDHGDYALAVVTSPTCLVLPGCYAAHENEPPLVDGYVDAHNGGCNSVDQGAPFTQLPYPDIFHGAEFTGTSGWYLVEGENRRDTDWFTVTIPEHGYFEATVIAEQPVYLFELGPTDCEFVEVQQSVLADGCEEGVIVVSGEPGAETWLWVGPSTFEPPANFEGNEFRYRLGLGLPPGPGCLDLGTGSDYSHGCVEVVLDEYGASYHSGNAHDDLDLNALCGDGPATPGGDVMASVYLDAGGGVSLFWHPLYIEPAPSLRYQTCFSLVADLRLDSKSCADVDCVSGYNAWASVWVDQPGWYWLVIDVEAVNGTNEWGNLYFDGLGTPPVPPLHDDCEGAVPLSPGPFYFVDDLSDATNRFDPGRDGCPGSPGTIFTGRDVVYEVEMADGLSIDAVMTPEGGWGAALYLVRDCLDPVDDCVTAASYEDGALRLHYTAQQEETLWLVCDSYGNGPRPFTLQGSIGVTTDAPPPLAPAQLALRAAPNPFNPQTVIEYDLPRAGHARLRLYSLDGRLVRELVDDVRPSGRHAVPWDGRDGLGRAVASGAYVARLEAGGQVAGTRLLLLK